MSIIRVGLSETKDFSEGYDAIFGKKEKKPTAPATPEAEVKKTEEEKKKEEAKPQG